MVQPWPRQRYITKFNKTINTVTELIIENTNSDEINKSNDFLETVINKIHKLTLEILKRELNDKIKEQDLNFCTTLEFKLIQLRNSKKSYIDIKIKPHKSSSSRLHNVTPVCNKWTITSISHQKV